MCLLGTYSTIGDEALDIIVRDAQRSHPGIGLRMLMGHVKSKGLRIQWERLRQSLLRTDPSGVHERWRQSIRRRVYRVPGPLALWHIDGNHKLIRYVLKEDTFSREISLKSVFIIYGRGQHFHLPLLLTFNDSPSTHELK